MVLLVDRLRALDVEIALQRAVVRRVAVRRREQRSELGAQQHRMHETDTVVDGPRREHDRRGEHRRTEPAQPRRPLTVAPHARERHHEQRNQQDQLGSGERAERARHRHQDQAAPTGSAPVMVRKQKCRGSREHRKCLSLQHAVGCPQVRVQGGEHPRDDAEPGAANRAAEQADQPHGAGAEQARPQQVREHALHAEHRRDREEDDVQGRVFGRGAMQPQLDVKRRDEALALGEEIGTRVVEVRVALRVEVTTVREDVHDP